LLMPTETFELKTPPIYEVACGFHFDQINLSDPFQLNDYIQKLKSDGFTTLRMVRPIEVLNGGININFGDVSAKDQPYRLLLESTDGNFLIQIQHDKFFYNWKRSQASSDYPSFSGRGGRQGIKSLALKAFSEFKEAISRLHGKSIICNKVQLAKFDHFERKISSDDLTRISELVPMFRTFGKIQSGHNSRETNTCNIQFGFNEVEGPRQLSVQLSTGFVVGQNTAPQPIYRLETMILSEIKDESTLDSVLTDDNEKLRHVFLSMLNRDKMSEIYGLVSEG